MKLITGTRPKFQGEPELKVTFREEDMLNLELVPEYRINLQETADVLACNVEEPKIRNDGTVEIISNNFNDSYFDMMAELTGEEDEDDYGDEDYE